MSLVKLKPLNEIFAPYQKSKHHIILGQAQPQKKLCRLVMPKVKPKAV